MPRYIYQNPDWPNFTWHEGQIQTIFGEVRHLQGRILGGMAALGFAGRQEASFATLVEDVITSSEIEGEHLPYKQVRSSIAKRLGIESIPLKSADRTVEGIVEMLLDATQNGFAPLSEDRLFGWHTALFPAGRSGLYKIATGAYRSGEMQIVSGALGEEKVHFEAPPAAQLKGEMDAFIHWFNADTPALDPILKAAVAHFRFIIIHPFDDGNGRIARALSDLLMARSDGSKERYYSLSAQMLIERKQYYAMLQKVQHNSGDITEWMLWFLQCFKSALIHTLSTLKQVLHKTVFWQQHEHTLLNERQRLMLNKLLNGFRGKLQSSKWAKLAKCSSDTALRDIQDLIQKGILKVESAGGRSTSYELVKF